MRNCLFIYGARACSEKANETRKKACCIAHVLFVSKNRFCSLSFVPGQIPVTRLMLSNAAVGISSGNVFPPSFYSTATNRRIMRGLIPAIGRKEKELRVHVRSVTLESRDWRSKDIGAEICRRYSPFDLRMSTHYYTLIYKMENISWKSVSKKGDSTLGVVILFSSPPPTENHLKAWKKERTQKDSKQFVV